MFSEKILKNIVIITGKHGNKFLWQLIIIENKSFFISLYSKYQLLIFFLNACPVILSLDEIYCTFSKKY